MSRVDFRIVFTKCDKVSKAAKEELEQNARAQMLMLKRDKVKEPSVFFVSAKDKIGLGELRDFILDCVKVDITERYDVVEGKQGEGGGSDTNENL